MIALVIAMGLISAITATPARAELSPNDEWVWVDNYANGLASYPRGGHVDGDGNVYVLGVDQTTMVDAHLAIYGPQNPSVRIAKYGTYGTGYNPPQFDTPAGMTVDSTGRFIIADMANSRIMILNPDGSYNSHFGQFGTGMAEFDYPSGVAVDSTNNIYVTDTWNGRVQKFNSSGNFLSEWYLPDTFTDAHPDGIALDAADNIYVMDPDNGTLYRYPYPGSAETTKSVTSWTGGGSFNHPQGVDVDSYGTVYVADSGNSRVVVFDANLGFIRTFGSFGTANGEFDYPSEIIAGNLGYVYVYDQNNDRVQQFVYSPDVSDTEPPVTTSNIPDTWIKPPFTVSLTAVDTTSPITATYYSTDGQYPTIRYYDPGFIMSEEGTYAVKYYSVDAKGNTETPVTQELRLDSTPPTTTTDLQPEYITSATVNLFASDALSGIANTWYRIENGAYVSGNSITISMEGSWDVEYWSTDKAGNEEPAKYMTINVVPEDNDPPVTSVNFSDQWVTTEITVTITAVDLVTGVDVTYFSMDGSAATTTYTAPFKVSADGIYPFKFYSIDLRGNVEDTKTATLKIDKVSPETTATVPETIIESGTITLSATDNLSGVYRTEYRIDGGTWTEGTEVYVSGTGNHTVEYRSQDVAGNVESLRTILIEILPVDVDPPSTQAAIPTGWVSGPFEVMLESTDAVSEVAAIYWQVNTEPTQTVVDTTTAYFTLTEAGVYDITFYAVDTRDNVEPPETKQLKIDNLPPTTTSNNEKLYVTKADIILSAVDDRAGVQSTKWRIGTTAPFNTGTSFTIDTYGDHTFQYYSIDGASNVEQTLTETLTIVPPDTDPPTSTIDVPSGWVNTDVTVSITA
ncbi:MAG: hypothetical protein CVT60_05080, partial [Actinobacteria bacterium HGW-Actinobacteria-10]